MIRLYTRATVLSIGLLALISIPIAAQNSRPRLLGTSTQGSGAVYSMEPDGSNFRIDKILSSNGSRPLAGPIEGSDTQLYGTTTAGGSGNVGLVYRITRGGAGYTKLHEFQGPDGAQPQGRMVQASDGNFYGTTTTGGTFGRGVLFRMNLSGSVFQVIHHFTVGEGGHPAGDLIQASNNDLYGMTLTGIFRATLAGTVTMIHTFSTPIPQSDQLGGLIQAADNNLYGMTVNGGTNDLGTIFRIGLTGSGHTVIRSFAGTDGSQPVGTLMQDAGGTLYGTTTSGGVLSAGVIFKVNTNGTGYTLLMQFDYTSGWQPRSALTEFTDGLLYGTASGELGSLMYSIEPDGDNFAIVHVYQPTDDLYSGTSMLVGSDGIMVGVFYGMGSNAISSLFNFDPSSGSSELFTFNTPQGNSANSGLTIGISGKLYGTTVYGGAFERGTLYSINADGTGYQVVKSFDGYAWQPYGTLVGNPSGTLFGVAYGGGTNALGALYSIKEDGSNFTIIYEFDGVTAGGPRGGLTRLPSGVLYGMTEYGGQDNLGVIFSIEEDGSNFTVLQDLFQIGGASPTASLLQAGDGYLYGMTPLGGTGNKGVVFKIAENGTGFTKLHDFTGTNGQEPYGNLINGSDDYLYGVTRYGFANTFGGIFRVMKDGTGYEVLHSFASNQLEGIIPFGDLMESGGKVYGTTTEGGTLGGGTFYRMNLDGSAFEVIKHLPLGIAHSYAGLTSIKGNQTITFNSLPSMQYGTAPFALTATAYSGLPVSYTSSDPAVATISGSTVTILTPGTTQIKAMQPGDAFYNPAADFTRPLVVTKTLQTITFQTIPTKVFGDPAFTITATASSGLPIQFVTGSVKINLVGDQVTINNTGSVTIEARQAGDSFNEQAVSVQTFCINAPKPTITSNAGPLVSAPTLTTTNSGPYQWFFNGSLIPGATGITYVTTASGNYALAIATDECYSELSDPISIVVVGDIESNLQDERMMVYPNPVKRELTISLMDFGPGPVAVALVDLSGRAMDSSSGNGGESIRVDVERYPSGLYIIKAVQGQLTRSRSFIKE
ncbi:MAG: T9SS type A sorting domain-containing protein [Cyclobacteriaceae bacterium]|nr:T9SS type A sorting domain-containing protein [Cyclobacteriaceae bacterium]